MRHGHSYSYEQITHPKAYHVQLILWAISPKAKDISYRTSIRNGFAVRMLLPTSDYEFFPSE